MRGGSRTVVDERTPVPVLEEEVGALVTVGPTVKAADDDPVPADVVVAAAVGLVAELPVAVEDGLALDEAAAVPAGMAGPTSACLPVRGVVGRPQGEAAVVRVLLPRLVIVIHFVRKDH